MSSIQDNRNGTRNRTRLGAAILFMLVLGMGYTVSSTVQGAVGFPTTAEDQDIEESPHLASECVVDGLVFANCNLDL